jgi:hypothetical protein
MATTTNYGWGTPDDTDLVKDGALAIRDLGQDIDTTTKALNPETTTGDIAYRSATANTNTRLALGTAGQILTVNSGATAPEWAAPAYTGGKILQVVQATTTTATTIASTSFTDTTLTASITPSSASSRILVIVNQFMYVSRTSSFMGAGISLLRGATEIHTNSSLLNAGLLATGNGSVTEIYHYVPLTYVDSPSSTSSLTYKTQAAAYTTANSGTSTWQKDSVQSSIILMEIGA